MASQATNNNPAETRIGAIEVGKMIWNNAAAVGQWLGGAVSGEFNKQQTIGQIAFDAVVSMFPILGEGTSARDAIAISLDMCQDDRKLKDHWEWIKLVLCVIAIVPLVGGILKGAGKLVVRAFENGEDLAKVASDVILFLNRMGVGNSYRWLQALDFTRYQSKVLAGIAELIDRLVRWCQFVVGEMRPVLPARVVEYMSALPPKLMNIRKAADRMVPQALKELNDCLFRVRAHLVEGTWADIKVGGRNVTTREAEGRLAAGAHDVANVPHPKATMDQFHATEGWPDLRDDRFTIVGEDEQRIYAKIESFSRNAPIVAKTLSPGETHIFRVIQLDRPKWTKSGEYWLPRMPINGKDWREGWAVLYSWNTNGGFVELTHIPSAEELARLGVEVPSDWSGLRAWSGLVSSQFDDKLGRYWSGGETQLFIDFKHAHNKVLLDYVQALVTKRTGWTDVNVAAVLKAVVTPMEKGETAAKTVPQGYTSRIPTSTDKR
ncbi:hypothetical protein [Caballeronia sp. GAFFF1]|uniref:hypothetical protein n=1 Tax=Caballeronia sp. GAFFF1 TaxID=2921779 RepID=UPI00202927B0|nr:hypothetical protein [Caballeronia sp. GAFFF1]